MAWLSGWGYRRKITIDNTKVDGALAGFPVMVKRTSADTDFWDNCDARQNVTFTSDDGITELVAEVELFDHTPDDMVAWVKIPSVASGSDTVFYMYYDSESHGKSDSTAVWDDNYKGIWHFSEDPDDTPPQMKDSTQWGNDGTCEGSMDGNDTVAGKSGKCLDFDGSNDAINVGQDGSLSVDACTIEMWIYIDDLHNGGALHCYYGSNDYAFIQFSSAGNINCYGRDAVTPWSNYGNNDDLAADAWQHVVMTCGSGNDAPKVFVNGSERTPSGTGAGDITDRFIHSVEDLRIGRGYTSGYFHNGLMDEFRISSIDRGASWVKASFNSGNDSLVIIGDEEEKGGWLSDWSNRRKITVDSSKIDSTLSHFPLTAHIGTAIGITTVDASSIFDELGANSKKIAITEENGVTQLYGEIEQWDDSGEKAVIHFGKSGSSIVSAVDTDFYIYYDSSKADNTTYIGDTAGVGPTSLVWDNSYAAVWHLGEAAAGITATDLYRDSTGNAYHGDDVISDTNKDGQIGLGQSFDGSDDYINLGTGISAETSWVFSWEYWFKTTHADYMYVVGGNRSNSFYSEAYHLHGSLNTGAMQMYLALNQSGTDPRTSIDTNATYDDGNWHHVVFICNGLDGEDVLKASAMDIYVDGEDVATSVGNDMSPDFTGIIPFSDKWDHYIGSSYAAPNYLMEGNLDESRFSRNARSLAWFKATYNAGKDSLLTWAAEERTGTVLSDTLTLVDEIEREITTNKEDTLTLTDVLKIIPIKTLKEALTFTDDVISSITYGLTLAETLSLADGVSKLQARNLSETMTLTDIRTLTPELTLEESLSLTDVTVGIDDLPVTRGVASVKVVVDRE